MSANCNTPGCHLPAGHDYACSRGAGMLSTPGAPVSPQPPQGAGGALEMNSMTDNLEAAAIAVRNGQRDRALEYIESAQGWLRDLRKAWPAAPQPEPAGAGVDLEAVLARGAHLTLQAIQREIPPNDADRGYDDTVIQEFRSLKAKLNSAEQRIEELEAARSPASPPRDPAAVSVELLEVAPDGHHRGVHFRTAGGYNLITSMQRELAEGLAALAHPAAPPRDLEAIGKALRTQDNRCTDQPLFVVERKRRDYGYDPVWGGDVAWLSEGVEVEKAEADALEAKYQDSGDEPDGYSRTAYVDRWEFVTACFTEQGCKDFIAVQKHNLGETRIYAHGSYRNKEWRTIREFLLSAAPRPEETPAPGTADADTLADIECSKHDSGKSKPIRAPGTPIEKAAREGLANILEAAKGFERGFYLFGPVTSGQLQDAITAVLDGGRQ
jgi:hypothetical protein